MDDTTRIMNAQKARGVDFGGGKYCSKGEGYDSHFDSSFLRQV